MIFGHNHYDKDSLFFPWKVKAFPVYFQTAIFRSFFFLFLLSFFLKSADLDTPQASRDQHILLLFFFCLPSLPLMAPFRGPGLADLERVKTYRKRHALKE